MVGVAVASAAFAAAVPLAFIAYELHMVRRQLGTGSRRWVSNGQDTSFNYSPDITEGGHAVYVYREGQWSLAADNSEAGYAPVPPTIEGGYDGQAVKCDCQPVTNV